MFRSAHEIHWMVGPSLLKAAFELTKAAAFKQASIIYIGIKIALLRHGDMTKPLEAIIMRVRAGEWFKWTNRMSKSDRMDPSSFTAGRSTWRYVRRMILCCLALACAGCAVIPLTQKQAASGSSAILGKPAETRLGKELLNQVTAHHGLSGFYLLSAGMDAFLARALMIDAAEKSIDLQYFIVKNDVTTQLLFSRLLRAADRGVQVRMLIDDTNVRGKLFSRLAAHPNIQVRTFNPMQSRYFGALSRYFNFLVNADELNHRMHNKLLAVDGTAAVVGGRNLSDAYFEARPGLIFMDLDLWAVGPIVQDMGIEFDVYWDSPWATPVGNFRLWPAGPADLKKVRKYLTEKEKEAETSEYAVALKHADLLERLERGKLNLVWARAELVYDSPQKVNGKKPHHVGPRIRELAERADREVIFVSPYFIPQSDGMRLIADLRRRGVRVLVLTNSLRANDIVSAYAAYRQYRPELLRLGVELYELKPSAAFQKSMGRRLFGSRSLSSLHAKSYLFDRQTILLGSFNFDPRSKHLNTEMGLIVHSPELAKQVRILVQEGCNLKNSYHPVLENKQNNHDPQEVWLTKDKQGQEVRLDHEPGKGLSLHLTNTLLRIFPLEGLL